MSGDAIPTRATLSESDQFRRLAELALTADKIAVDNLLQFALPFIRKIVCKRMSGYRANDTPDVIQECTIELLQAIPFLFKIDNPIAYICGIAINKVRLFFRRERKNGRMNAEGGESNSTTENIQDRIDQQGLVEINEERNSFIDRLDDNRDRAIFRFICAGYSPEEIRGMLDLTDGTYRSRQRAIRRAFLDFRARHDTQSGTASGEKHD
ncbi:MAG: sigma-70 family RNA polymerase sigma factor [Sphingobium sp.]